MAQIPLEDNMLVAGGSVVGQYSNDVVLASWRQSFLAHIPLPHPPKKHRPNVHPVRCMCVKPFIRLLSQQDTFDCVECCHTEAL